MRGPPIVKPLLDSYDPGGFRCEMSRPASRSSRRLDRIRFR